MLFRSLFYVSPSQINAQTPTVLQPGEWEVRVKVNLLDATERVVVRPYSPGLFSVARHADGTLVTRNAPAKPAEFIVFYGAGFGPTRPLLLTGELAPLAPTWLVNRIEAKIGEISLATEDLYYWGMAPGFAGLYQFNLRVPPASPSGDLEVLVKVDEYWRSEERRVGKECRL